MPPKKAKTVSKFDEIIIDQPDHLLATRAPNLKPEPDPRLDVFGGRKVNVDFESSILLEIKPQALQNELKFRLNPDQDLLLDPKDLWVKLKVRITLIDENGTSLPIPRPKILRKIVQTERKVEVESPPEKQGGNKQIKTKTEKVDILTEVLDGIGATPCPCFSLAIFKSIRICLGTNQCQLTDTSKDLYHFQVFIRTLLEIPEKVRQNQLAEGFYILDDNGLVSPYEGNKGLSDRYIKANMAPAFTMVSPLMVDGLHNLHENHFFPPGFPVFLEFDKNPVPISMTCNKPETKLGLEIVDMSVMGRYYKLTAQMGKNFEQALNRNVGFYSYTGHHMNYLHVPKDTINYRYTIDEDKVLPEKLVIALVPSRSMRGTLDSNCFYFEPHNLQSVSVIDASGRQFTVQADENREVSYNEFYRFLIQECNLNFMQETLSNITPENYAKGRFLIVFDFSRFHNAVSSIDSIPRLAKLELVFKFKSQLSEDFNLLLMSCRTLGYVVSNNYKVALV